MSASKELNLHPQQLHAMAQREDVKREDVIHFSEIIGYLYEGKWIILLVVAVTFFIAVIRAYMAIPIYYTEAMIQIESQQNTVPGLESVSQGFNNINTGQAELDTIRSRQIIGEVVDELDLIDGVAPRYFPYIGAAIARHHRGKGLAEPFFGLDEYAWGGEVLTLDHFDISGNLATTPSAWQLITGKDHDYILMSGGQEVLSGEVGEATSADYQNSTVEISVSRLVARPGVSFTISRASRIAAVEAQRGRISVNQSGDTYAKSGMVTISREDSNPQANVDIVNAVARAYVKSNLVKQTKEAAQKLEFIDGQLPALKAKQEKMALALQKFQREARAVNITAEIENTTGKLGELKDELSALRLQKQELQENFTEEHPTLRILTRKIDITKEDIRKLDIKLQTLPEKEWEFLQKSREVKASTELYMNMLNTAQELQIAKAGMTGNARIVDQAVLIPWKVKPSRTKMLLIGLMSGLILGIIWVLLRRMMMQKGLEDPARIERETGFPVFATIPHSENQKSIYSRINQRRKRTDSSEPVLLAYEYNTDMAVEAFRSFRTNMRFSMKTSEDNVVIIAGPSPEIGKSFFSSNYAAVSSREGQRVLLIDADMRKGHLHRYMGSTKSPGLSELIAGDVTLRESVHKIKDHFHFLSCGKRPPNPSELLETEGFKMLLEEVNQAFDLVIIDTPPILAVTDASIIAQYGGKVFVLLRSGKHHINEILAATSQFEKSGVKVAGLLINDQGYQSKGYGYGGYGYGYGYQYNYK